MAEKAVQQLYRSTFTYMGKQYEKTSTKSQREADRKADKLKADLENGVIGISKHMRVSAWAYEWLDTYKRPSVGDKTYDNIKRFIENVINPQIGGLRLSEVTATHLQKVLNSRIGYSYSDVKRLRDTIKSIFLKAKESRLINHNPAENLIMPAAKNGKHRSITSFERYHFIKTASTHHYGLMFMVMLYCGLRTGEVVALSVHNFDIKNRLFNITSAMESGKNTLKEPKTEAGLRKIPIPDDIYYDLVELVKGKGPFEPIFTQIKTGKRHTFNGRVKAWESFKKDMDDSMGAKWEKVKAKDGKMRLKKTMSVVAPDFVPYCLRHTYCTDLQTKGVSLKMASYLMGHSSIAVTANIYTHITEESFADAARLINNGKTPVTDSVSMKGNIEETA